MLNFFHLFLIVSILVSSWIPYENIRFTTANRVGESNRNSLVPEDCERIAQSCCPTTRFSACVTKPLDLGAKKCCCKYDPPKKINRVQAVKGENEFIPLFRRSACSGPDTIKSQLTLTFCLNRYKGQFHQPHIRSDDYAIRFYGALGRDLTYICPSIRNLPYYLRYCSIRC